MLSVQAVAWSLLGLDGCLWSKPQPDWPMVGSEHPHESYLVQYRPQTTTLFADETDQRALSEHSINKVHRIVGTG